MSIHGTLIFLDWGKTIAFTVSLIALRKTVLHMLAGDRVAYNAVKTLNRDSIFKLWKFKFMLTGLLAVISPSSGELDKSGKAKPSNNEEKLLGYMHATVRGDPFFQEQLLEAGYSIVWINVAVFCASATLVFEIASFIVKLFN